MKKADREIYRVLTSEIDSLICDFCKYSVCMGGESPCDCGDSYCEHPLKDRLPGDTGLYGGMEPGDDCWGFRPSFEVSFCADIVGIVLSNHWRDGYYIWQNKRQEWKMAPI